MGQDTAGGVGGSGVCGVVGALALALASADWYWCPRHSWALPCTAPCPLPGLVVPTWLPPPPPPPHNTHPVLYTLYSKHPVPYTAHTKHPVLYTVYSKHPVTTCNISYIEHCIQQTTHPVCCTHTGLGRQDILILDTGHHGKTDNLRTLSEVTWHIFAMCSITEHPCAEDNTV